MIIFLCTSFNDEENNEFDLQPINCVAIPQPPSLPSCSVGDAAANPKQIATAKIINDKHFTAFILWDIQIAIN